jgi:hypothetical protein
MAQSGLGALMRGTPANRTETPQDGVPGYFAPGRQG